MRSYIGTVVVPDLVAYRQQPPAGVERPRDAVRLITGVVHGDQMLCTILGPLDRPPEQPRQVAHQDVLRVQLATNAEAPASVTAVHPDARRRNP